MINHFTRILTISSIIFFTTARSIFAIEPDSTPNWSAGPYAWQFIKMVIILAVVVVLIWVILSLLRKITGVQVGGTTGVEIVGGVPLGPRKSIQFIRIGSSLYLIGATEHHLTLIDVLKDTDEIANVISRKDSYLHENSIFSRLLSRFRGTAERER